MTSLRKSRSISVSIGCGLERAYDFLCVPENFPKWASGLAGSLTKTGGEWLAETQHGPVRIRFSERNAYGVLDHWVYPRAGVEVYVPMRIVANGDGCELILMLFRLPEATDEEFAADAAWVRRDMSTLKNLLEDGESRKSVPIPTPVPIEKEAK
jgi:hypothetical protein